MSKLKIKKVTENHIIQLLNVQKNSADPKSFTYRNKDSFLDSIHNERVIGMFHEDNIIAYSIFDKSKYVDYLPEFYQYNKVGQFSGTVIDCLFKGKGIQKYFFKSHIQFAKDNGFDQIMALVHADNKPSRKNIEKAGLKLIGKKFIESKNDERLIYIKDV